MIAVFVFTTFFTVSAQDGYEIRKIQIKGNSTFSKNLLLEQTTLREFSVIDKYIFRKEPVYFNAEFAATDIERLKRFYQSEGFLNVTVNLDSVQKHPKKQRVNLFISVTENNPVKIGKTNAVIKPAGTDSLTSPVQKILQPLEGKRFRDNEVRETVTKLTEELTNRGFVYASAGFNIKLHADTTHADIEFHVEPNELCNIGKTEIEGNKYVIEELIRKQLAYAQGDVFSGKSLDKTRRNLYSLQLFRIASVSPQTDRRNRTNPVPVKITIQEIPRWTGDIGAGYGTEEKFRTFANLTYRSVFADASRLNLYLKHSALDPYYVSLRWIQPQFLGSAVSISVNPYLRRQTEPGFDTRTYGLNLPLSWIISEKLNVSVAYYLENVKQYSTIDNISFTNVENENFLYNKSGITATAAYNTSNPLMMPEQGGQLLGGFKINGYFFGGDFDYSKIWLDARRYFRTGDYIFSVRAMSGTVFTPETESYVPVEDRFYSGGSTSVRGWKRSELGPKRTDGTPRGGKSILELNAEVRRHIFWLVDGALFADAGNVWIPSITILPRNLSYSVGAGLRLKTPIGPVRLDMSIPVFNEKKTLQFFINVGQAF